MQHKPNKAIDEKVNADSEYSVNLARRLGTLRSALGLSQSGMDDLLSLGKNSWQRYEHGKNIPGSQVVAALVDKGFNANWILSEQGEMRLSHQVSEPKAPYNQDDFVYIPKMVPIEISTGHGSEPAQAIDLQYHAFRQDWLATRGLQARNLAIVTARGDSMEPTIPDGATLLVDTSVTEFNQEGIFVVRMDGHLFAKRLQRGDGGSMMVISDNPHYNKVTISKEGIDNFSIEGKVVWLGRSL